MDTLCIPTGRDEWSLRLAQIDKMASIYKGAVSSLVLDAELMSTTLYCELESSHDHNDRGTIVDEPWRLGLEARACIACSAWMSRSWTLQEGQLPRTIAIQFLDDIVVFGRRSPTDGAFVERSTRGIGLQLEEPAASFQASSSAAQELSTPTNYHQPSLLGNAQIEDEHSRPCDCVGIALEHTFFSAFFGEVTRLNTVWNELTGRSTTMPSDIPFIITNILDMENIELLKYHEPGEVFKAIILSLDVVPLSIFFNTGPKHDQDGDHRNRWVPEKVGTDTMEPGPFMYVHPTYFFYEHLGQGSTREISAYSIATIIELDSKTNLYLEDEDAIYYADICRSATDRLDLERFNSTCAILRKQESSRELGVKRGACFYFREDDEDETGSGPRWWRQALNLVCCGCCGPDPNKIPEIDLTFNCPIRLQRVTSSSETLLEASRKIHKLRLIKTRADLRILHGTLINNVYPDYRSRLTCIYTDRPPNFSPLVIRKGGLFNTFLANMLVVIVCIFTAMWASSGFAYIPGCPWWAAGIAGISLGVILYLLDVRYLHPLVAKWLDWKHIRSFEAVAARLRREGEV